MILALSIAALVLAAIPAAMLFANLPLFRALGRAGAGEETGTPPVVSVLIPARDEESGIAACIQSALECTGVTVEVVVLDDDSSDSTSAIVQRFCDQDSRVSLIHGNPLPAGWNGKQHACQQLADAAKYDRLLFIDADVRLRIDSLSRLIAYQDQQGVGLLSAFPHQVTGTWMEKWLIPMMHFILLGYLPFSRMRQLADPSLAAGCGQLFLTTRQAYDAAGGHRSIKSSRHDGVKLPRSFRAAGIMTDVVDGSDVAECRMYRGAGEMIRGVLKNATEGIANPKLIIVFTVLLLGCSLLPLLALVLSVVRWDLPALVISLLAVLVSLLPRMMAAAKLKQSWFGAFCHAPATVLFLVLQWIALGNQIAGRQIAWRGRTES